MAWRAPETRLCTLDGVASIWNSTCTLDGVAGVYPTCTLDGVTGIINPTFQQALVFAPARDRPHDPEIQKQTRWPLAQAQSRRLKSKKLNKKERTWSRRDHNTQTLKERNQVIFSVNASLIYRGPFCSLLYWLFWSHLYIPMGSIWHTRVGCWSCCIRHHSWAMAQYPPSLHQNVQPVNDEIFVLTHHC